MSAPPDRPFQKAISRQNRVGGPGKRSAPCWNWPVTSSKTPLCPFPWHDETGQENTGPSPSKGQRRLPHFPRSLPATAARYANRSVPMSSNQYAGNVEEIHHHILLSEDGVRISFPLNRGERSHK